MLVAVGYHPGDQDQALRLADWMRELAVPATHDLLLIADKRCAEATVKQIRETFERSFKTVKSLQFVDFHARWPASPNNMWQMAAKFISANQRCPWLWLEPDCILLKPSALDEIEVEYAEARKSGKHFLGELVTAGSSGLDVITHCSGVAVYPADMYQHAGSALLASDQAWDVAAAPEIVPQMVTSNLIMHRWKHPAFEAYHQVLGVIFNVKPRAVLFHADKTGSLIPLLREERKEKAPKPEAVTCDIFIKSYPDDYPWLKFCLRSIEKFARGFGKTHVVVPDGEADIPSWLVRTSDNFKPVLHAAREYGPDGYLSQQVFKLHADEFSSADYILYADSDMVFRKTVRPQTFFSYGADKILWMVTPYEHIDAPWRPYVEKFLGRTVEFEFMRQHPFVVPRWLLAAMREFCLAKHGVSLARYVMDLPYREFSEFNALGAYAFYFHNDKFDWINTETVPPAEWPELTVLQKHSWSGLSPEIEAEFDNILSGSVVRHTSEKLTHLLDVQPSATIQQQVASESEDSPAQQFRKTYENTWDVENDNRIQSLRVTKIPWASFEDSVAEIERMAERLKQFQDGATHTRFVRKILHDEGVIELDYRYKKRGKWKKRTSKP